MTLYPEAGVDLNDLVAEPETPTPGANAPSPDEHRPAGSAFDGVAVPLPESEVAPTPRGPLSRRTLLRRAGVALAGAAIPVFYAHQIEPHWPRVVECELPIRGLPAALVDKRLVQLSDLHVGPWVDYRYLIGVVRRVNDLEPDLTVITGDFITYREPRNIDDAARLLEQLEPGPLGAWGVLGNHDYGRDWAQLDVADQVTRRLEQVGVRMLRNQSASIGGLWLVGFDDLWAKQTRPKRTMDAVPPGQPRLVLSHNPDIADWEAWEGFDGWMLSGHTHGGQVRLPFCRPFRVPLNNPRYTAGEVQARDNLKLYVNRGLGYHWPFRFNVRPEITVFTLRTG